jgi:hypothetical protein
MASRGRVRRVHPVHAEAKLTTAPRPKGSGAPPAQADTSIPCGQNTLQAVENSADRLGIPQDKASFTDAMLHGGTFGLSDEIGAGLSAPLQYGIDKLPGKAPADAKMGDYYDTNLQNIRSGLETYAKEHPVASAGGEALGGLMDFNPEAVGGAVAKGFLPAVKQGAATGGAVGAATGFGNGEGGFEDRAKGAAIGGTAGAVVGGAAPVVVPLAIGGSAEAARMVKSAIAP